MPIFLKTKFYPVNPDTWTIINKPYKRLIDFWEDCRKTPMRGFCGIKGKELRAHGIYNYFNIIDDLPEGDDKNGYN